MFGGWRGSGQPLATLVTPGSVWDVKLKVKGQSGDVTSYSLAVAGLDQVLRVCVVTPTAVAAELLLSCC